MQNIRYLSRLSGSKKLTVIIILIITLLVTGNLVVTNILATTGEQLTNLQLRKENLKLQNSRIKLQIISGSSLNCITAKAQELGMNQAEEVLNLVPQQAVAMNQP